MAIVQVVRRDLANAKAPPELLTALDKILVNEAEVAAPTVADGVHAEGQPVKKKVVKRRVSQEVSVR